VVFRSGRVEDQIFQLSKDPLSTGVVENAGSGLQSLRVPGTDLEMKYEVEEAGRRIRIFYLTGSSQSDPEVEDDV